MSSTEQRVDDAPIPIISPAAEVTDNTHQIAASSTTTMHPPLSAVNGGGGGRISPTITEPPTPLQHTQSLTESTQAVGDEPTVLASKRRVLLLMWFLKVLTSYDSGAFSAVLGMEGGISDELRFTVADDGFLGSVVFLGNTLGCAVAGLFFQRHKAVSVLTASMLLHLVSTVFFGLAASLEVCVVMRFVIGFSLAFVVVYSVVWVDTFAPRDRATTWMAAMNVGVPIGILIGFVVGGSILPALGLSWRWAFFIKGIVMAPLVLFLHSLEGTYINERRVVAVDASTSVFSIQRITHLGTVFLKNSIFMTLVIGLTILYFVVTALQVFLTQYLRAPPFNASMHTIVFGFGGCAVSAPVIGVIVGGRVMDQRGGYQADIAKSTRFIAQLATAGAVFAIGVVFMKTTLTFLLCLWLMLFAGGAVLPAATGLLMAVVRQDERSAASSFANIFFNVFGYFLGPLLCGFFSNLMESLTWGISVTLLLTSAGAAVFWLAARIASTLPPQPPREHVDPSSTATVEMEIENREIAAV